MREGIGPFFERDGITCPACGAGPMKSCVNEKGVLLVFHHEARDKAAIERKAT